MFLLGLIALGTGVYYFFPEYISLGDSKASNRNEMELREASTTGFLRGANLSKSNVIASEETRVIRAPVNSSKISPLEIAKGFWTYVKEKNDMLYELGYGEKSLENRGVLRANIRQKPRLLMLPSREGKWANFQNLPNANFNVDSGPNADELTTTWRDQYGNAGGFPRNGIPYISPNVLYSGNPWGPGGQLFVAAGNQYRNPDYIQNDPSGHVPYPKEAANDRLRKRVHFNQ